MSSYEEVEVTSSNSKGWAEYIGISTPSPDESFSKEKVLIDLGDFKVFDRDPSKNQMHAGAYQRVFVNGLPLACVSWNTTTDLKGVTKVQLEFIPNKEVK